RSSENLRYAKQLFQKQPGCDLYAHERRLHEKQKIKTRIQSSNRKPKDNTYSLANYFQTQPMRRTFIPFLDEIEKHYCKLSKYIVTDAGYGSGQNYENVLTHRK